MNIDDIRQARNASPFVSFTLGQRDGGNGFVVVQLITGSMTLAEADEFETLAFDTPLQAR